jgi:hypothetical protein
MNPYDPEITKKDGKKVNKVAVLYTDCDEEPCLCDGCDEKKPCTHIIDVVHKNVTVICRDCLNDIISTFYTEKELRNKKIERILLK